MFNIFFSILGEMDEKDQHYARENPKIDILKLIDFMLLRRIPAVAGVLLMLQRDVVYLG
jgi:hypothetical protein